MGNDSIKNATSVLDYIFRELGVSYLGRNDLAHVTPHQDNDLGGGIDEGQPDEPQKDAVKAVVSKVASNGYVRGNYRQLSLVKTGGAAAMLALTEGNLAHDHAHHHESSPDEELEAFLSDDEEPGVAQTLDQIRAEVLAEAGVNPVGELVSAIGVSLTQRADNAAARAGKARELQAKRAAEARMKGYEGDACGSCGNFTLVRNGTCMKCNTCGSTSGCS
jgi:ribonucleoside-diphosphate reductase alpha chain